MSKSLWLLMRVFAVSVTVGVGNAMAQTVIVRDAPPGATVEVSVNTAAVQSAVADRYGDARIETALPTGASELGMHLVVDRCEARVRVSLVTPGVAAEPPGGCVRTDIPGVFSVRPVTSFVVDLAGGVPSVHLAQGPVPPEWLDRNIPQGQGASSRPPLGFMLFGGGGFGVFSNAVDVSCGDVFSCVGGKVKLSVGGGATVWVTRFLAAQVGFVKPSSVTLSGESETFRFGSTLNTRLMTLAANIGGSSGRVRPYGQAGLNYHKALFTQTQTIPETTITVGDVTTTVPGGTQTLEFETRGWGWLFGGGLEAWPNRSVAIYVEGQYLSLRGDDTGAGEGTLDDHLMLIMAGVRIRIGR